MKSRPTRCIQAAVVAATLLLMQAVATRAGEVDASVQRQPQAAAPRHPERPLGVVVIDGLEAARPFWMQFQSEFRDAMVKAQPGPLTLYFENVDAVRFSRAGYLDDYERWLREKYNGRHVDAIVASASVPLDRLLRWRREIWGGAPMILVLIDRKSADKLASEPGISTLPWTSDAPGTVALAKELFPATREIFFIGGDQYGDLAGEYYKRALNTVPDLRLVDSGLVTVQELRLKVSQLPEDSVILYSGVYKDANGTDFVARDALDALAATANRPIFGLVATYLDHGIVGGVLLDPAAYARASVARLARLLENPGLVSAPAIPADGQALIVDYRQLQRWAVPERRVPEGTLVKFRPLGLWEQYRNAVTLAASLLVLQSLVLGYLLMERRRRQAAESGLRLLSGRLLLTQEEERRRIAGELHDDVNQRVALLTIGLDGLARDAQTSGSEIPGRLRQLATEARTLGSDVHALARQLRPPQIDTGGLPAALLDLATRVQQRTGVEITVLDHDRPVEAPSEAAIVLYRVAQEALQNATKHSGARSIRIVLVGTARELSLSVSDDGNGMAPRNDQVSSGLGIAGMRERLNLVGGSLSIMGIPGEGSRVGAHIPLPLTPQSGGDFHK